MLVVRSIMQAKFGYGGHLAAAATEGMEAFTKAHKDSPRWRVLTEISGQFDSVTLEVDVVSLDDWETARARMYALPEFEEFLDAMQEHVISGRLEFLNVESQG